MELIAAVALLLAAAGTLHNSAAWFAPRPRPFLIPLALLLAVMTVAALFAPQFKHEALRFTGRFTVGVFVYLLFSQVADGPRRIRRILGLAAAPTLVVSLFGILESIGFTPVFGWLESFRVGPSYAGGAVRAAGTLQYPTITAMYLGITFAWLLGLMLDLAAKRRWPETILLWCVSLASGSCLILTLTRSALLVLAVLLAGAALLLVKRNAALRLLTTLGLLGGGLVLVFTLVLSSSNLWLRLTTFDQRTWYQAAYLVPRTLHLGTGQRTWIEVTVENKGLAPWAPGSDPPFYLAYHWLTEDGKKVVDFEGLRTRLPRPVPPKDRLTIRAQVRAPDFPGRFLLAWDLVQEHRFWFSKEYSPSSYTRVLVQGPPQAPLPPLQDVPMPRLTLDRFRLWGLALQVLTDHPLLGVGPDNFRHVYGTYAGLALADRTYHTHNLFVEFFTSAGLLGGLIFLWLAWRLVRTSWKLLAGQDSRFAVVFSPVLAVGAILTHGLFDYFLEFTPTYLMIFAAIGLLEAAHGLTSSPGSPRRPGPVACQAPFQNGREKTRATG